MAGHIRYIWLIEVVISPITENDKGENMMLLNQTNTRESYLPDHNFRFLNIEATGWKTKQTQME